MSVYADFCSRHVGVHGDTRQEMIESLGYERIVDLIADAVPSEIREEKDMGLRIAHSPSDILANSHHSASATASTNGTDELGVGTFTP